MEQVLALSAVAPDLQVSALFGWRKGAFTSATTSGAGALSRAQGGTLFLDEIDKLDLSVQKSLLRLIEDRRFMPIGGEKEEEADVRFIVGTNADLERAAREGRFLLDLYYRINVLPVRLPPLGERRDEVAGWARFMYEDRETLVQAGDCVHQRPGIRHYLFDYSPDMEYLEIVSPADFKSVDVAPVCAVPPPTPWAVAQAA